MKYFHIKGIHPALGLYNPIKFWKKKDIKFSAEFNDSCKYDVGKRDQKDWNKLVGVDFTPLNSANKPTSVMVAWRYYNDQFQLGLYTHTEDVSRTLPQDIVVIDKKFTGSLDFILKNDVLVSARFHYGTGNSVMKLSQPFQFKTARIINPWFGGTNPPPKNMNFKLDWKYV